jgi:thymidylate synthase (FAD)
MKRVLNSGSVRLPDVKGTERERLDTIYAIGLFGEDAIKFIFEENPTVFNHITFKFEIKAPLLVFNAFQEAHLGTLDRLEGQDHQMAYLPPSFYKQDDLTYKIMDVKSCNAYNTKLYNFYVAAFNFYNNLIRDGVCEEQAKLVLPQGIFVNFLWVINAKDLIDFISNNSSKSPEISGYCSTFMLYLDEHLPLSTRWLKANRWGNA